MSELGVLAVSIGCVGLLLIVVALLGAGKIKIGGSGVDLERSLGVGIRCVTGLFGAVFVALALHIAGFWSPPPPPPPPPPLALVTTFAVGDEPSGVAVSSDGSRVYTANEGGDSVSVVDPQSGLVRDVPVDGDRPIEVAVAPSGCLITANFDSDTVSVIDDSLRTNATVAVGVGPYGVTVSPDGSRVYVNNDDSATVSVLDGVTNELVGTVAVGQFPHAVAVTADGSRAYVTNNGDASISEIDTASMTVVRTIRLDFGRPDAVEVAGDGSRLYVTATGSRSVFVIDVGEGRVVERFDVGGEPMGIALHDGSLHLATAGPDELSVIDADDGIPVVNGLALDSSPSDVVVDGDGRRAYVTHADTDRLSVIDVGG